MAWFDGKKTWKWFLFGVFVGALIWVVGLVFGAVTIPTVTFSTVQDVNVRQQILSGTSPNVANQLFSYLGFTLPISVGFMGIIFQLLSSGILFALGSLVAMWIPYNFKTPARKTAIVGLLGVVAATLILTGFSFSALTFQLVIALLLMYLVFGFVASWLSSKLDFLPKVPELR